MELTRGLALAPVTWLAFTIRPASQLPVVLLTVSPAMLRVTSSKVTEYWGAQASRWMRFCGSRRFTAGQRYLPVTDMGAMQVQPVPLGPQQVSMDQKGSSTDGAHSASASEPSS